MLRKRKSDDVWVWMGDKKIDRCAEERWVPTTELGESQMGIGSGPCRNRASQRQRDQGRQGAGFRDRRRTHASHYIQWSAKSY